MPETLKLSFNHIDRSFDPTMQPAGSARVLRNVDTSWMDGRIRMGTGPGRTDLPAEDAGYTVNSCLRVDRPDGSFMMIVSNDRGEIDLYTAVTGQGCVGSVVTEDYQDNFFSTEVLVNENFNEDNHDFDDPENPGGY